MEATMIHFESKIFPELNGDYASVEDLRKAFDNRFVKE